MGQAQSHEAVGEGPESPSSEAMAPTQSQSADGEPLSAAERKEYEAIFDENDALRENNAILRAITDALHDDVEELQQRVEEGAQREHPLQCPVCGMQLPNEDVEKRHLAFHRYEINADRQKDGLKPYTGNKSASSRANASTTPVHSKGREGGSNLTLLTLRSLEPLKKKAKRKRRLSVFRDNFADDEPSPRIVKRKKLPVVKGKKAVTASLNKSKPKQSVSAGTVERRTTRSMAANEEAVPLSKPKKVYRPVEGVGLGIDFGL